MSDLTRRQFVFVAASTTASLVLAADPQKSTPVDAGPLSDYAKDGITTRFAQKNKFFVIRNDNRLYAVSTACSHKNFTLAIPKPDATQLKCPKHDSVFNLDGTVADGPAKKPLARLAIKLNDQKHVIVDPASRFEEKDWEDSAAFIKLA